MVVPTGGDPPWQLSLPRGYSPAGGTVAVAEPPQASGHNRVRRSPTAGMSCSQVLVSASATRCIIANSHRRSPG